MQQRFSNAFGLVTLLKYTQQQ